MSNTSSILSPSHVYSDTGQFNVSLIVWKNCSVDTVTYDVFIDAIPLIELGNDTTLCQGESLIIDGATFGNLSYLWSNGATTSAIDVTTDATYSLAISTQNECTASDSITIDFLPYQNAAITTPFDSICEGDSDFMLNAITPGGTWSGLGIDSTGNFDPLIGAGNYTVYYEFAGQCSSKDSLSITISEIPEILFSADITVGCAPLLINFFDNSSNPSLYSLWTFGDGETSNQLFSATNEYLNPGQYSITLENTSNEGCISSLTLTNFIEVYPNPNAAFQYDQTITNSGTIVEFTDNSTNTQTWDWSLGNGTFSNIQNPENIYTSGGEYSIELMVTSEDGCTSTDFDIIDVQEPLNIYVPNSFTPNGDGRNDIFTPVLTGVDNLSFEFIIFDRWGGIVFETNDSKRGWNGRDPSTGQFLKNGTYTWKLQAKSKLDASTFQKIGHVNLLR